MMHKYALMFILMLLIYTYIYCMHVHSVCTVEQPVTHIVIIIVYMCTRVCVDLCRVFCSIPSMLAVCDDVCHVQYISRVSDACGE